MTFDDEEGDSGVEKKDGNECEGEDNKDRQGMVISYSIFANKNLKNIFRQIFVESPDLLYI